MFEDDQFQPKNTRTAALKLLDTDKVQGLIVYGTSTALAVTDLAETRHVPMIVLSILNKVVEGKHYVMKHWCTAERLNAAVVQEVRKRRYKNVAIVSMINDAMLRLRDLYLESGVTPVVLNEEFAPNDYDFRTIASKIKQRNPDAVYVLVYPPQPGVFVKTLRGTGYSGELFGVHNLEDAGEVKVSNGTMIGMWLANADDNAGENYHSDYLKRFSQQTALGGASGFDAAKLFIEAAKSGNDLNDYLHHVSSFHGAFGVYSATKENDFDFTPVIKVIEANSFRKLH